MSTPRFPFSTLLLVPLLIFGGLVSTATAQSSNAPFLVEGPAGFAEVRAGASSVGDVNNDGSLDVLITGDVTGGDNETPGTTLYLGNGDGTFSPAGADLTDVRLSASAMADVNGDGNQDLVITGLEEGGFSSSPTATLYLGNGDGTFSQPGDAFTGVEEGSVSIANVDGKNGPDVLITGQKSDGTASATLYLQQSDGSFAAANASLTGVLNSATAIADVNGDNNKDILLTGGQEDGAPANPVSTLYLGNGDGTFSVANANLTNVARSAASIADVDGDGNKDLLLVGAQPGTLTTFATLYFGDGTGTFTEVTSSASGLTSLQSGDAAIADFDDDGIQDILLSGEPESGTSVTTTLFLGNGNRTFSPANTRLVDVGFSSVSAADFYSDGDPDVVLTGDAEPGLSDRLEGRFYVNNTIQTPPNRAPIFVQAPTPDTLAAGRTLTDTVEVHDPDGDQVGSLQATGSLPDVSVTSIGTGTVEVTFTPTRVQAGRTPTLEMQAQDVKGASTTASASIRIPPFFGVQSNAGLNSTSSGGTATADVDGNGTADVFVANTGTLYLGREDGTFGVASADFGTVDSGGRAAFGDVNGDGAPDLVFSRDTDPDDDRTTPKTTLHLGNGDGSFDKAANANLNDVFTGDISIGDVNNDQNQDLLITNGGASTVLYLGNGDGTFTAKSNTSLSGLAVAAATAIGDVDEDGNADVVVTGSNQNLSPVSKLYLGNGDGTFTENTPFSFPSVNADFAAFRDVGSGTSLDLVLVGTGFSGPTTTVLLGNGDGTFTASNATLTGVKGGDAALADVDEDGNTDLFVAGDTDGSFDKEVPSSTLYLGDGNGGFSVAGAGIENVAQSPVAVDDIDGDGDDDLTLHGPGALYQNLTQERTPSTTADKSVGSDGTVDF
ncbi:MAG: beta strand repeat-containing protein, partial [Salinibacter sp.]